MRKQVAPAGAVDGVAAGAERPEVITVKLDELREHPRHAELDKPVSEDEIDRLARDVELNGLQSPIEVTPEMITVCGHQRVRALRKLGWAEIPARVRYDLAQEGEAAVEERMINDNLLRRQLDPVSKARYYRGLKEISRKMPYEKRKAYQFGDSRDELAKEFGMSGRNIERLVKVLDAPKAVQDAVSANRLSLKAAGKVAGADKAVQAKIAGEIQAGKGPEAVVAEHIPDKEQERTHKKSATPGARPSSRWGSS